MTDLHSRPFDSPYVGLRPFREAESPLFFGRGKHIFSMLQLLRRERGLAVIGASGCGKSSLVRAGLLPALRESYLGDRSAPWICVTSRPGAAPYRNLAADMISAAESAQPLATLEQTLRRGPNGLRDAVRDLLPSPSHKMLVLIDQFEEIFRFGSLESVTGKGRRYSESAREGFNDAYAFIDMLVTAANSRDTDFYVAITMRSDYVGECDTFRDLPEWVTRCQFLPPRLTLDEMRDAIERPPQYRVKEGEQWIPVFNGSVDSDVTSTLMAAMVEHQEPLPLAQHALLRMWNDAASESTGPVRVSRRHAERCLGPNAGSGAFFRGDWIAGALAQHADELYDSLGYDVPSLEARRKRIARRMFCALCEEGGAGRRVRRLTSISEVAATAEVDPEEIRAVMDHFSGDDHQGRNFLVPSSKDDGSGDVVIDIGHESLVRYWPRLQDWLREEQESASRYRHLAESAKYGEPLTGRALRQISDWFDEEEPTAGWAERYEPGIFDSVVAFLERSRAIRERTRWIWGIVTIVGVVVTLVAIFSFARNQTVEAENRAVQAENRAVQAENRAVQAENEAIQANNEAVEKANQIALGESNWHRGVAQRDYEFNDVKSSLLFLESAIRYHTADSSRLARSAVIASNLGIETTFVDSQPVNGLSLHPREHQFVTWSGESMSLWDRQTKERLRYWEQPIINARYVGDGSKLIAWDKHGRGRLWSDFQNGRAQSFSEPRPAVDARDNDQIRVEISGDGYQSLIWANRGPVLYWDLRDDQSPRSLEGEVGPDGGATISGDGSRIAVWNDAKNVVVHDARTGQQLATHTVHRKVYGVSLSTDGTDMLIWGDEESRSLELWNVGADQPECNLPHDAGLSGAIFNRSANHIVSWSRDRTARIWRILTAMDRQAELLLTLQHHSNVGGATFNEDESELLTWSYDNKARVWPVTSQQGILIDPLRTCFHEHDVSGALFLQDAKNVMTWSYDSTIRIWNKRRHLPHRTFESTPPALYASYGPDASTVYLWTPLALEIWDVESDRRLAKLPRPVPAFASKFEGESLTNKRPFLTWDGNGMVRFWTGKKDIPLPVPTGDHGRSPNSDRQAETLTASEVLGVSVSDDKRTAITWKGQEIQVWRLPKATPPRSFSLNHTIRCATLGKDAKSLLAWNENHLTLANLNGQLIADWHSKLEIHGVTSDPAFRQIAIWDDDHVTVWSPPASEAEQLKISGVRGATFDEAGDQLAAWTGSGRTTVWNLSTGEMIWQHPDEGGSSANEATASDIQSAAYGVLFSQSGEDLIGWGDRNVAVHVKLQPPDNPDPLRHRERVLGAAFSPAREQFATWSADQRTYLWDLENNQPRRVFESGQSILGAKFNASGTLVLTWDESNTARLWDTELLQHVRTFSHTDTVLGATFNEQETQVLTWSRDGTASIWMLPTLAGPGIRQRRQAMQIATGTLLEPTTGATKLLDHDDWVRRTENHPHDTAE